MSLIKFLIKHNSSLAFNIYVEPRKSNLLTDLNFSRYQQGIASKAKIFIWKVNDT